MTVQITLIGTGRVGTSMGLALSKETSQLFRVGHDRQPARSAAAQKMGALDKVHLNLHAAVKEADIVVLSIPVDEIYETLSLIAEDLKKAQWCWIPPWPKLRLRPGPGNCCRMVWIF